MAKINPNLEVIEEYINAKTKIFHRCKIDGYQWKISPNSVLRGTGCPACCGHAVLPGVNDLATLNPRVVEEWDYEKNGDLLPSQVTYSSAKRVWWKCKFGHSWDVRITDRQRGEGCPECAKGYKTSLTELKTYYYIKKYFNDAISSYSDKMNGLSELDIYIPSLKFGIEYDGQLFHHDINHDRNKDLICQNLGIHLVRIREPKCPQYDSTCSFIYLNDMKDVTLHNAIVNVLFLLNVQNPDVNFARDIVEIENLIMHNNVKESLAECYPDIASEWHPTKNGNLHPRNVRKKSNRLAWWLCPTCENEYQSPIQSRTNMLSGCPQCGFKTITQKLSRPVYCLELDCVFPSVTIAQHKTNATCISQCVNSKRQTSGNHPLTNEPLHWYFLYDKKQNGKVVVEGAISLRLIKENDALDLLKLQQII